MEPPSTSLALAWGSEYMGSESFSARDSSAATLTLRVTSVSPEALPLSRDLAVGAEPMSSLKQPAKELKQPEKLPDTDAELRPSVPSLGPLHEASECDLHPLPSAVPPTHSHLGLRRSPIRAAGDGKQYFQRSLSFFAGHVSGIRRGLGFLRGEASWQGE